MTSHPILIHPARPAVIAGAAHKLDVLIRVQAPDEPESEAKPRQPYHLSLVIDRSGSMSGAPLEEAKRCAAHVFDRLAPTDVASLVVFDDRVNLLCPATLVGDRRHLHQTLDRVTAGGSTNLHGGWKAGFASLPPDAENASIARVILLSDGNANVGETTDVDEIAALCAEAASKGVSTSTYGLGRNFNEDLMVAMARQSGGNHYYGDTAADLMEPFAAEFDLISNLFARNLRLSLAAPAGVKIRLLNDYRIEQRGDFPTIHLPDLAYGAEAWALVQLELPAEIAADNVNGLLQAAATGLSPSNEPVAFADAKLSLPAMAANAWAALVEDPLVVSRRSEIEAADFITRARKLAERGNWEAIGLMMEEARERFAGNPWVLQVLEGLVELAQSMDRMRFRKEALYSSSRMNRRLSAKDEMLSMSSDREAPSFLKRKSRQGKADPQPGEGGDKA
ncbi:MAG: VWA domain-containing protein [Rhodocyclaceae bacterium]|nr:VWA domain-containing protein [Rhodocyclaceae bacterium]